MGIAVTSAPAVEPLTLAEAKLHLRYESTDEDDRITSLIKAARIHAEMFTGKAMITQTFTWKLDGFPTYFRVPRSPLQSVTSIAYLDANNASQTLASSVYSVDTYSVQPRIVLAFNQVWPVTYDAIDCVTVTFVAGYGASGSSVPETLRQAMLLLIGHWFESREEVVLGTIATKLPTAAEALMWGERLVGVS